MQLPACLCPYTLPSLGSYALAPDKGQASSYALDPTSSHLLRDSAQQYSLPVLLFPWAASSLLDHSQPHTSTPSSLFTASLSTCAYGVAYFSSPFFLNSLSSGLHPYHSVKTPLVMLTGPPCVDKPVVSSQSSSHWIAVFGSPNCSLPLQIFILNEMKTILP